MSCDCATLQSYKAIRGTTFQASTQWKQPNGQPVNLTGFHAALDILQYADDADALLHLTDGAGITFDTVNGIFLFNGSVAQVGTFALGFEGIARLRVTAPDNVTVTEIQSVPFFVVAGLCGCGSANQLLITAQGPQGVQGIPGTGGVVGGSAVAGATISNEMAVVIIGGLMFPADVTNPAHAGKVVGVATQSGLTGVTIAYAQTGEVPGGSFTQDARYYIGAGGVLSTTPNLPGAVWSQAIGYAKTNSTLIVQMGSPFNL